MAYAEGTEVSPEKSRAEIEGLLKKYGAEAFSYAYDAEKAGIGFRAKGRSIRFILPMPDPKKFGHDRRGRARSLVQIKNAVEAEHRRRVRALDAGGGA